MSSNIKQIKLGAPSRIVGGAAPNAELSVQTMERCEEMTLHDSENGTKCTKEGAMATAARIIAQLMHERSISASADGWSITFDVLAMADAAKHGGAEHPVQMALMGADGTAVCWAVEGDATPGVSLSADGVLTLPAACSDTLRIKAIRWDDRELRTMTTIPVSVFRKVADLLEQYPSLAAVLAEYPSLAAVLAASPALAAVVVEWPMVVNSLVETGKRNAIVLSGDNWFNTDYIPNANTDIEVNVLVSNNNAEVSFFGGRNNPPFLFQRYNNAWRILVSGNWTPISKEFLLDTWYKAEQSTTRFAIDGVKVSSFSNNFSGGTIPMFIGHASNASLSALHGSAMNGKFGDVIIKENENVVHHFAPFHRNGIDGFIDIVNPSVFLTNQGTGTATLTTDPK